MDGALADKSQIAGPGSILFGLHDLILDTRGTSTAADDTYAWVHVVGGPEANYTSPQTLNDGLGTVRRLTGSATGLGLEIFDVGNLLSSGLDYVQLGAFTGGPDGKAYFAVSGPNYVLMPLTGSAQYRGGTRGTYINAAGVSAYTAGDIAMTANFASRDVTGSASNFRAVNAAGASVTLPSGLDFTFTASQLLAQRHRFEGSASNATMTGTVIGEFGGPSGGGPEEAGIAYQLQTATPGGPMLFGAGGLERID